MANLKIINYTEGKEGFDGNIAYFPFVHNLKSIINDELGIDFSDIPIPTKINNLILIKNINISVKHRNRKHGSNIIKRLQTKDTAIILMADIGRQQLFSFNLINFYQNLGFKQIDSDYYYPIMLWISS